MAIAAVSSNRLQVAATFKRNYEYNEFTTIEQ
jgi:hypothetical protein